MEMRKQHLYLNLAKHTGITPLYIAAEFGNRETARELIKLGAKMEQPSNNGLTPLLIAAERENIEIVKI